MKVFSIHLILNILSTGFSPNDLFEIGYLTMSTKDAISSAWISEALKRLNSTDSNHILRLDILNYLVDAYKNDGYLN